MTEKILRRGVRVLGEYTADYLDQQAVGDHALRAPVTLRASDTLASVRAWLASGAPGTSHQGFPVVDDAGALVGVLTRRDLFADRAPSTPLRALVRRDAVVIFDDCSLRTAADVMARERIGRLPVVSRDAPRTPIGIVTRSDLIHAHVQRLKEHQLEPGQVSAARRTRAC